MIQIRKNLKIIHFDRQYVKNFFFIFHKFVFYFLFIDDFKIYRNIYRALKIVYLIFICLTYEHRRKITNVFILILNSHKANMQNVVEIIAKLIKKFDRDLKMKINEKLIFMCVFAMIFIDNMPQQTNNAEFFRHNTKFEYRNCFYLKNEKNNLKFDVIKKILLKNNYSKTIY